MQVLSCDTYSNPVISSFGSDKLNLGSMQIYPNPVGNFVTIKYQLSANVPATIYVYNSIGQLVKQWKPKFADHSQQCYFTIPVSELNLPTGIYAVVLKAGSESHNTKLIIK